MSRCYVIESFKLSFSYLCVYVFFLFVFLSYKVILGHHRSWEVVFNAFCGWMGWDWRAIIGPMSSISTCDAINDVKKSKKNQRFLNSWMSSQFDKFPLFACLSHVDSAGCKMESPRDIQTQNNPIIRHRNKQQWLSQPSEESCKKLLQLQKNYFSLIIIFQRICVICFHMNF